MFGAFSILHGNLGFLTEVPFFPVSENQAFFEHILYLLVSKANLIQWICDSASAASHNPRPQTLNSLLILEPGRDWHRSVPLTSG